MSCEKFHMLLSAYIDEEVTQKYKEHIEQHLQNCSQCREKADFIRKSKQSIRHIKIPQPTKQEWDLFTERVMADAHRPKVPSIYNIKKIVSYAAIFFIVITAIFLLINLTLDKSTGISLGTELEALPPELSIPHQTITIRGNIPRYQANSKIKGINKAKLTHEEREFLYQEGFVVTDRKFNSFSELYRQNQEQSIPSFVTVDAAMIGFSHILARLSVDIESQVLVKKLKAFVESISAQLWNLHKKIPEQEQDYSLRALAFFRVASILLELETPWPPSILEKINPKVERELALIYNGSMRKVDIQTSPIFDYPIDYNKFKIARKHSNERGLQGYYLACEWFARCSFRASKAHLSETKSALLIMMAAVSSRADGMILWEEMHTIFTALYGEPDDPHLIDYHRVARDVYGERISIQALSDTQLLIKFCRKVTRMRLPRIRSELRLEGGLRIFAQRGVGCDFVLQQLTYPYVGERDLPRIEPSLLDIAVIMGIPKAREIAKNEGYFEYKDYEEKVKTYRQRLKKELKSNTPPPWQKGGLVGSAWMYEGLAHAEGKGFPIFSYSDAWHARKLTTIACGMLDLGSHKPIFTGQNHLSFYGALDPYPEVFNRMATRIRYLMKLLRRIEYPFGRGPARELFNYHAVVKELAQTALKMLENKNLTARDYDNLGNFALGWRGRYRTSKITSLSTLIYRNDTQSDNHFYAGIGSVRELWVAIPINGKIQLARGGIFVLFEFQSMKKPSRKNWRKPHLMASWLREYIH